MNTTRMKLCGGPISPFVRKVGISIIEKGLEDQFEFVRSYAAMAQANTTLQQYNPLSKIPTLITVDGNALFDSDVICEYLDCSFASPTLFPTDGSARWQARRWNALGSGLLDALVLWRFERNRPATHQLAEVLHAYEIKLKAVMSLLEAEMPLIAATPFAIGHISIGCAFGYLDFRFSDIDWRSGHPHCTTWFNEFMQRPSAQRTIPYEGIPSASAYAPLWTPVAVAAP